MKSVYLLSKMLLSWIRYSIITTVGTVPNRLQYGTDLPVIQDFKGLVLRDSVSFLMAFYIVCFLSLFNKM